ncbi:MAG: hypothetical protein ACI4KD_04795 [Oscillospiraceae bacterium]
MGTVFKLEGSVIKETINVYENAANNAIEAMNIFKTEIDGIMGTGWKGEASKKFINIIDDYEKSTQEFLNEIQRYKQIMLVAGTTLGALEEQGKNVGSKMKQVDIGTGEA